MNHQKQPCNTSIKHTPLSSGTKTHHTDNKALDTSRSTPSRHILLCCRTTNHCSDDRTIDTDGSVTNAVLSVTLFWEICEQPCMQGMKEGNRFSYALLPTPQAQRLLLQKQVKSVIHCMSWDIYFCRCMSPANGATNLSAVLLHWEACC